MKYKVGDRVKIAKKTNWHGFNIGETVEIIKVRNDDEDPYQAKNNNGEKWYLNDEQIENKMKPQDKVDFTVEEIRRAAETCPDFKRIMKTLKPEVFEKEEIEYIDGRIYAFYSCGDIYKLQRIDRLWSFVSFEMPSAVASGWHSTPKEAIKYVCKEKIKYFTSQEEFVRWCAKELGIS